MARREQLPDPVRRLVAGQIAGRMPATADVHGLAANRPAPSLAEDLELFELRLKGSGAKAKFATEFERTGHWHHQIRRGDAAIGYSRSAPDPHSGRKVHRVMISPLAAQIERGLAWLDRNMREDALVRLVSVRACHIHAFHVLENDIERFLIVDTPTGSQFELERLYTRRQFFALLRREPRAQGIPRESEALQSELNGPSEPRKRSKRGAKREAPPKRG